MKSSIDILGGPYKVIADAVRQLPRRLPEYELGEDELACAIERRVLRVAAQNEGLRWKTAEEVGADLDAGADLLRFASDSETLAAQMLADASIRFMPGISPRVSCALASAVSAVREGLHLWREGQPGRGEQRLADSLRCLLYDVSATTAADAILAREVAHRVLRYIAADLDEVTPNGIVAQLRAVRELCRAWRHFAFRGAAEVER